MRRFQILITVSAALLLAVAFLSSMGCNQPATVQTGGPAATSSGYTTPPTNYPPVTNTPAASYTPPGRGFGNTIYATKSTAHMVGSQSTYSNQGFSSQGYQNQGYNAPNYNQPGYPTQGHTNQGYNAPNYSGQSGTPPGRGYGYTLRVVKNTSHMPR